MRIPLMFLICQLGRFLKEAFSDPLLGEMLLCPTSYYGSAQENDIDFATFTMLFDAIFKQGLARPSSGIRAFLDPLVQKLDEFGVKRLMNNGVKKIKSDKNQATAIVMDDEIGLHSRSNYLNLWTS
jgi:phytoene dehydrogenase-like protein